MGSEASTDGIRRMGRCEARCGFALVLKFVADLGLHEGLEGGGGIAWHVV